MYFFVFLGKLVVELKDRSYHLIFVGAPDGKQDEVAKNLLMSGIDKNQLTVRKFVQSKERLKELFCEVDLCIMPSRSEGFGLTALEALSSGLPILILTIRTCNTHPILPIHSIQWKLRIW